jgi:hypothetical protein
MEKGTRLLKHTALITNLAGQLGNKAKTRLDKRIGMMFEADLRGITARSH